MYTAMPGIFTWTLDTETHVLMLAWMHISNCAISPVLGILYLDEPSRAVLTDSLSLHPVFTAFSV